MLSQRPRQPVLQAGDRPFGGRALSPAGCSAPLQGMPDTLAIPRLYHCSGGNPQQLVLAVYYRRARRPASREKITASRPVKSKKIGKSDKHFEFTPGIDLPRCGGGDGNGNHHPAAGLPFRRRLVPCYGMNSGVQMLCGEAAVGTGAVPRQHLGQPGGLSGIGGEVFKGDAGARPPGSRRRR